MYTEDPLIHRHSLAHLQSLLASQTLLERKPRKRARAQLQRRLLLVLEPFSRIAMSSVWPQRPRNQEVRLRQNHVTLPHAVPKRNVGDLLLLRLRLSIYTARFLLAMRLCRSILIRGIRLTPSSRILGMIVSRQLVLRLALISQRAILAPL